MSPSYQGSGVRGIRLRRLRWRGLETGSRQTYTGTKLETADTAKGSLWSTAPILDPTVGALGRTLNVEGLRLACCRRAPPRIWTLLGALAAY